MQQQGTLVVLDFGPPHPSGTMGMMHRPTNLVEIYVQRHRSPKEVASTIVHESSYVHRFSRGARATQLDEVQARAREFLFQHGRRPWLAERRAIWDEVMSMPDYSDLSVR